MEGFMQYRQGDVLLIKVNQLPQEKMLIEREYGRIVLAHGEATGHAHAISDPIARFWDSGKERVLEIPEPTELKHEEHAAIPLAPGYYRVIHQREYTPERIQHVQD
jgi:hypothetical protein